MNKPYIAKKPDANGYVNYTADEHHIWSLLYEKQMEILPGRACDEYLDGLKLLNMSAAEIPQCADISKTLHETTGWTLEPVPSTLPMKQFFKLLAARKFPVATFIRRLEDLSYVNEPDVFHEIFGHCPLLTNPLYADFVQAYGELSLQASKDKQRLLTNLYFYTIEVGLLQTGEGLRIYGGGILSSPKESLFALESSEPERIKLDFNELAKMRFGLEDMQKRYFVIESFDELFSLRKFLEGDLAYE